MKSEKRFQVQYLSPKKESRNATISYQSLNFHSPQNQKTYSGRNSPNHINHQTLNHQIEKLDRIILSKNMFSDIRRQASYEKEYYLQDRHKKKKKKQEPLVLKTRPLNGILKVKNHIQSSEDIIYNERSSLSQFIKQQLDLPKQEDKVQNFVQQQKQFCNVYPELDQINDLFPIQKQIKSPQAKRTKSDISTSLTLKGKRKSIHLLPNIYNSSSLTRPAEILKYPQQFQAIPETPDTPISPVLNPIHNKLNRGNIKHKILKNPMETPNNKDTPSKVPKSQIINKSEMTVVGGSYVEYKKNKVQLKPLVIDKCTEEIFNNKQTNQSRLEPEPQTAYLSAFKFQDESPVKSLLQYKI